ncbi:MAG: hypothetical protein AAGF79_08855 [Pseudomonadota bacterium]
MATPMLNMDNVGRAGRRRAMAEPSLSETVAHRVTKPQPVYPPASPYRPPASQMVPPPRHDEAEFARRNALVREAVDARMSQPDPIEVAWMDPDPGDAPDDAPFHMDIPAETLSEPAGAERARHGLHRQDQAPAFEPEQRAAPVGTATSGGAVPSDFVIEKEHPVFPIPFSVSIQGQRFEGESLSVTQMILKPDAAVALETGARHLATIHVRYENFAISLEAEVIVLTSALGKAVTLQFEDPTGDHLPQLRYLINSYIAGDVVSLNGMLSYTGPNKPKTPKAAATPEQGRKERIRSISVLALSAVVALVAIVVVFTRYTTGHEMHPVFVDRAGQQLRATVGGQLAFLNPEATQGEVLFAVNSNSGDVLNFQMPCDCAVDFQPGMVAGSTVLPTDVIATVYTGDAGPRVNTMISVAGLSRAMRGDQLWLDFNNGRSVEVEAMPSAATRAATLAGDMFLPVTLRATDPATLSTADIGSSARLRITPDLLDRFGIN